MKRILLIGATGLLGNNILRRLDGDGRFSLRALIRDVSANHQLIPESIETVTGDLTQPQSLEKAMEGCDVIIATANAVAPRKQSDTFRNVDIQGYRDLIDLAAKHKCAQFIYVSIIPFTGAYAKYTTWSPLAHAKAQTEDYLKKSEVPYTIFQPDAFMDVYFAFMGSSAVVQNTPAHLANRPWKFLQQFYNGIKDDVANGKIGIIGDGLAKHAYIAVDNVAEFVVKAVDNPAMMNKTVQLGGPEALTAIEVKQRFENVLGSPLKIKRTPAFLMKALGNIAGLFSPAAANIFKLNYLAATISNMPDCRELAEQLSIKLVSAEEYLRAKFA